MAGRSGDRNNPDSPEEKKRLSESEKVFKQYLSRRESGEEVDPEEYLRLYPELKKDLEKFFARIKARRPVEIDLDSINDKNAGDGAPKILGDYRITRKIGAGGMATVYEAEQIPMKRRVALKILPSHLSYSDEAVVKFHREAEAAGRQSHPGIVSIFGVGEDKGVHYIAQELIDNGRTLGDWLDEIRGESPPRIGYFREVAGIVKTLAEALQFSHESGVIHRDITPTNILLTRDGRPKITDFGLAKVEDALALSRTGDFAGTPYYMSPEQAMSRRIGIDHKTDIFSLGVTFYELLTLERPFQGETSQEVLRKIVLIDPRNPCKVNPRVPNDLAVICIKAMEKQPEARYATMKELSEDIERFLQGETIRAKPASLTRKLMRRIRRYPLVSAAVGVAVLSLVVLVGYMLWSYPQLVASERTAREECRKRAASERKVREECERRAASEALARAERELAATVSAFLNAILSTPIPGLDGREIKVVDALEKAVLEVNTDSSENPDIEASLRHTLGAIYHSLGRSVEAEPLLRAALEASIRMRGKEDETTLEWQNNLAAALAQLGRFDEAEKLTLEVLWTQERLEGKENRAALRTQHLLGDILCNKGQYGKAWKLLEETVSTQTRVLGASDPDTIASMNTLALSLESRNRLNDAEALYRKCLDAYRKMRIENDVAPHLVKANLALVLGKMARYEEAETLMRESLEGQKLLLGEAHPQTIITINNLAFLFQLQGRFADAQALYENALAAHDRKHGGVENQRTLTLKANLAAMHVKQGRPVEGERILLEALAGRRVLLGNSHPETSMTLLSLGSFLTDQERFSEAEAFLLDVLENVPEEQEDDGGFRGKAIALLVRLYEKWGKPEKADEYRSLSRG